MIQWFCAGKDKPLLVLPTGTGKSVVCAEICRDVVEQTPHARVLVVTHVKELVRQNYEKLLAIWPHAPIGIYSAGLGRKDFNAQIMFCGIQSVYKKAAEIGHVDLVIVDEAHTLPRKSQGMWDQFFKDLCVINPKLRVGGMTATDFRLDSGNLTGGDRPQFDGVCYNYSIADAIKDGFLCEIVSANVQTHLRTDGVKKRGGEFIAGELERAVNTDALTAACCDELIELGEDRKTWLIFASGNAHAASIHEYLQSKGLHGYLVTQSTPASERLKATTDLEDGQCRYIVNNMILTTGFDCPRLDLIACLRPTQSAGLWVQICGRGTRLFPGKTNCLLLDFGRNLDRHGPIDQISGTDWYDKEAGEAPIKNCPECKCLCHAAAVACPDCGFTFPARELKITKKASDAQVFSFQKPEPFVTEVIDMRVKRHFGKDGKPDTMRVSYTTLSGQVSEFICYGHPVGSFAHNKATKWGGWKDTLDAALCATWPKPERIKIVKEGKYYAVVERYFKPQAVLPDAGLLS